MRRSPIWLAWAAGLFLAALVYAIGPDRFMVRLIDNVHQLAWRLGEILADLPALTLDAVRALTIGLYATFMALAFAVSRRGGHARAVVIVVTVLLVFTVSGVDPGESSPRWTAALLLVGFAALSMTSRLRRLP